MVAVATSRGVYPLQESNPWGGGGGKGKSESFHLRVKSKSTVGNHKCEIFSLHGTLPGYFSACSSK